MLSMTVHEFMTSRSTGWLFCLPVKQTRVLPRTRKCDHISPVLSTLHWLPVKHRIDFKILLITCKALNGLAPQCHRHARLYTLTDTAHVFTRVLITHTCSPSAPSSTAAQKTHALTQSLSGLICTWSYQPAYLKDSNETTYLSPAFPLRLLVVSSSPMSSSVSAPSSSSVVNLPSLQNQDKYQFLYNICQRIICHYSLALCHSSGCSIKHLHLYSCVAVPFCVVTPST